jgi:hypothetical protein
MRLAASNRRTVGLHDMVWGLGGRNAPQVDGCKESEVSLRVGFRAGAIAPLIDGVQGRAKSPLRVIDRRYGLLARDGLKALIRAIAGGMQRGRAAGPLAKMVMFKFNALNL